MVFYFGCDQTKQQCGKGLKTANFLDGPINRSDYFEGDAMKKILFIDACMRGEESRTRIICEKLIESRMEKEDYQLQTVKLEKEKIIALDCEALNYRTRLIEANSFSDEIFDYARQFASADLIVVGAPYWDLSFPAVLKNYFEAVSVCGMAFSYGPDGVPYGLCQAEKLFYVTTAGGFIGSLNFGYDYIAGLCGLYGIKEVEQIKAEGLDIEGFDIQTILNQAFNQVVTA